MNEQKLAAMLADIRRAQALLAAPWTTPGGPMWPPGHSQAWHGLEYVRVTLTDILEGKT